MLTTTLWDGNIYPKFCDWDSWVHWLPQIYTTTRMEGPGFQTGVLWWENPCSFYNHTQCREFSLLERNSGLRSSQNEFMPRMPRMTLCDSILKLLSGPSWNSPGWVGFIDSLSFSIGKRLQSHPAQLPGGYLACAGCCLGSLEAG